VNESELWIKLNCELNMRLTMFAMRGLLLILYLQVFWYETEANDSTVSTTSGLVVGQRKTILGRDVNAYIGIPYATPPTGELRFKKPIAAQPWEGVYNASTLPNTCMQGDVDFSPGFAGEEPLSRNTPVSEDCLYLNIWAPVNDGKTSKPRPTLVWIYGGQFTLGTSTLDLYQGEHLSSANNVIVASMQYRVGAFGFFYLGIDDAPGNLGLWDQNLALQWLHNNIEAFGGDKDSITIFGQSAGGASVTSHLLSPHSSDLISRGIAQSGSINAPWAYFPPEKSKNDAVAYMKACGCETTSDDNLVNAVACMQELPAAELNVKQGRLLFAPTLDGDFFPRAPLEMLQQGDFKKKQLIMGVNQNEGSLSVLFQFSDYFFVRGKTSETAIIKPLAEIVNTLFSGSSDIERQALITWYSDWTQVNNSSSNKAVSVNLYSDWSVVCPCNYFAELYSQHGGTVHYYYFNQKTSSNPWAAWMGVQHGDELPYVFGLPLKKEKSGKYTQQEKDLSRDVMRYYTTFAETGSPVSDNAAWPLYTRGEPRYFTFNTDGSGIGVGPHANRCAFRNRFIPQLETAEGGAC